MAATAGNVVGVVVAVEVVDVVVVVVVGGLGGRAALGLVWRAVLLNISAHDVCVTVAKSTLLLAEVRRFSC